MATKVKTKPWVKIVKRVIGFITLYLLLVWIIQMVQHSPCNGCAIPDWSYLTALIKVSKVFEWFIGVITVIILVVGFFIWCFGEGEK